MDALLEDLWKDHSKLQEQTKMTISSLKQILDQKEEVCVNGVIRNPL